MKLIHRMYPAAALALCAGAASQASVSESPPGGQGENRKVPQFAAPVPLTAAGKPIRVEAPGYASPAWHDVNGDGHMDLVVGQFAGGKMAVYAGSESGAFGERTWLQAGGDVAEVPGVW